jgi:hypothetical protein
MFQKEVRNSEKFQDFQKHEIFRPVIQNSSQYDIDFLISFLDLDKVDKMVLRSKLLNEKKDEFLDRKKRITSSQYQNSIKKIKKQIVIFNEDEEQ